MPPMPLLDYIVLIGLFYGFWSLVKHYLPSKNTLWKMQQSRLFRRSSIQRIESFHNMCRSQFEQVVFNELIMENVFRYVDMKSLCDMMLVCKLWYVSIAQDEFIWTSKPVEVRHSVISNVPIPQSVFQIHGLQFHQTIVMRSSSNKKRNFFNPRERFLISEQPNIMLLDTRWTSDLSVRPSIWHLVKNFKCMILGLDNSGKTTIVYAIKDRKLKVFPPTVYMLVEELPVSEVAKITIHEHSWRRHHLLNFETDGVIYVINACEPTREQEIIADLYSVISHVIETNNKKEIPMLILCNKVDTVRHGAMLVFTLEKVRECILAKYTEEELSHVVIRIQYCSVVLRYGLMYAFKWLADELSNR